MLSSCRWYHHSLNERKAKEFLVDKIPPGSFLVCPSQGSPGNYVLFIHEAWDSDIQITIITEKDGFSLSTGGPSFLSLPDLIEHYHHNPIDETGDSTKLQLMLKQSIDSVTSFYPTDIDKYYKEISNDDSLSAEFELIKVTT